MLFNQQQCFIYSTTSFLSKLREKKVEHFHVSWLSDFIFYPKPLYKSLHQSFFYSFITILSSESGATLEYSTIFTYM
jgi:hypothetical protein